MYRRQWLPAHPSDLYWPWYVVRNTSFLLPLLNQSQWRCCFVSLCPIKSGIDKWPVAKRKKNKAISVWRVSILIPDLCHVTQCINVVLSALPYHYTSPQLRKAFVIKWSLLQVSLKRQRPCLYCPLPFSINYSYESRNYVIRIPPLPLLVEFIRTPIILFKSSMNLNLGCRQ